MSVHAQVVIIGAGIVGCSAAYHLSQLGWQDVIVLDQGSIPRTGGSTSHAPGLVFQTNTSQTMCRLAQQTVQLYRALTHEDGACFHTVGSLEVALTAARWEDLKRRVGYAASWGLDPELLTPTEARDRLPLLNAERILGAYYQPTDGVAKAVRACEAMARVVEANGGHFIGNSAITGIEVEKGRVRAVITDQERYTADTVLLCAGIWGPKVGKLAGISIPLTPVQHQYVRTAPLPELAGSQTEISHPILRNQDQAMYMRQETDSYGVGSYQHAPMLVSPEAIRSPQDAPVMPSILDFTESDFAKPWRDAVDLLPALDGVPLTYSINGLFSFTPDSLPIMGESSVRGLWVAEAVWVTHAGGVGKAIAEWMHSGQPQIDLHECDINRFEAHAHSPAYVWERGAQQYREVYDIIHPRQQLLKPRPLRTSPFYMRQCELGAAFFEGRGWERPQWFESNAAHDVDILGVPQRGEWAARFWSPTALIEHRLTRETVALYDMTPLSRLEVQGRDALPFLQRMTTNQLDRPVGSVVYTLMCDTRGGIVSDITVARLADDLFQIGCNGPQDAVWLRDHLAENEQVQVRDITAGTCCLGVWGPRARDLVQSLTDADLSNEAFPYFTARRIFVSEIPCVALRVSYVGELGWELYTTADYGLRLWDVLWETDGPFGQIAGGRAAFDALRLEKGYRLWGADMTNEHSPYEAGLGGVVRFKKGDFLGRDALVHLADQPITRRLCCLVLDDPAVVVMGKEPIRVDKQVVGYVTSAAYAYSLGKSIAYGYVSADYAIEGTSVQIEYFGEAHTAHVCKEPLFDPKGARLRV